MDNNQIPVHYVCTLTEAEELISQRENFWVSDCGCREKQGECKRSRLDVCLIFNPDDQGSGGNNKQISKFAAFEILQVAKESALVPRPFRDNSRQLTDGICFCCDDCCGYFLNQNEICDKGKYIAQTDLNGCTDCGVCEDVCYFKAREFVNGKLSFHEEDCYGCGLCPDTCPVACIELTERI